MAGRVVHSVDVEITGELDPSLARAIGMTDTELKRLSNAAKTFNQLMSKMVMPREAAQAANQISSAIGKMESRSTEATRRMRENFEKVGEAGKKAAEKIQGSLARAFDSIVEHGMHLTGIGGILGGIGGALAGEEFIRGAFETRAERGVLQNQMRSMTEATGHAFLASQVDTMIRNMEGRETPVRYDELMKTATLLIGADPKRFESVGQVHKMLGQIADISRSPEAFGLASASITKMIAEGTVDAAHLRELSIDTGFQFREGMAKALHVTPEQMTAMMKEHKFTGAQLLDALFKSIDEATGPGGPAAGHAEAQLAGLAGIEARFIGHWRDFQESFGIQLENFISPIADKVFALLTPAALTHAFDQMSSFTRSFGAAIGGLVEKLGGGKAATEIQAIGNALGQMIGKLFGTTNFGAFFKEVQDPISGIHTVLTATGQAWQDMISTKWADNIATALGAIRSTVEFIQQHFEAIKIGLGVVAGILTAAKLGELFNTFAEAYKNIKSLVITAGTVIVNSLGGKAGAVTEAAETAGAIASAITSVPAAFIALAGIAATELHKRFGILGTTPVEPRAVAGLPGTGIEGGAARGDLNELFKSSRQIALEHQKAAEAVDKTTSAMDKVSREANSAASSLNTLASKISSFQMPSVQPPIPLAPVVPHQHGGIAIRPHVGLVGESGPEAIIPLKKGAGGFGAQISISYAPVFNGLAGSGAQSGLGAILTEHAKEIAREVQRVLEIQFEQQAVV